MKKSIILSTVILAGIFAFVNFISPKEKKEEITVCHSAPATASFAALANDISFVKKHDNPEEIVFHSEVGKMITFKGTDGKDAKAFFIKAPKKTNKYLIVIHEWWGLNDHIKKEAEKYYGGLGNINVIALDLYDGQVATTAEEAGKMMQSVKAERAEAIINGAIKFMGKKPQIATIGWCFGGGWSLQSSIIAGDIAKACVIYYGMPEKNKERLGKLKADVLGIFASEDQWINADVVAEFESNLEETGKKSEIKSYGAVHGFANPSNPKFNKEYADEAYAMSVKFIKDKLSL